MANDKLDWFPIYWQRFIIGTLEMNAEEIGAYFLLLIHQWDKGFVPTNSRELKKISRVSDKKLVKVLEKFEKIDEKYFNQTLESIRLEQKEKHAKSSKKGKDGANARWHKQCPEDAQAMPKQCETDSIRVEESRVEERRVEKNRKEEIKEEVVSPVGESGKIYPRFISVYDEFIKLKTSCPAKIDGQQGKAAKAIISYLKAASNDKSDDGILNSWQFILNHWGRLESFYQDKLKLSEINSNIINIIGQIKNGRATTKKGAGIDSKALDNFFIANAEENRKQA
jgi:uncharacterized protein YdaU (DUF1376 family)